MKRSAAALLVAGALGCGGSREPDVATLASNSDQIIWEAGQKAFERKLWENARQHFRRIVDGFPQSEYGPAARLALGDTYFREAGTASYVLAVSAYREFLTLYPSHPRADYAQFQVAEGYFKQKNPPDRDQTAALKALDEFQKLLDSYPGSSQAETARQRVQTLRQNLARSEFMVGYFYQRTRQACRSSVLRYENVLSSYPDYQQLDEVLYRLAECLDRLGRAPEALPRLAHLLEEFPNGLFAAPARLLMSQLQGKPSTVTPAPPDPFTPTNPPATPEPSPSPTPTPPAQLK